MPFPSKPRTVLVTGAAKRLGAAIALDLAAHGWNVAVHYRHSAHEAQQTIEACAGHGVRSAGFAADFDDENAVRQLLPQVVRHFGTVDAVVNSASLFAFDDAGSFSYPSLQAHMQSNVAAPLLLAQALAAHWRERDGLHPQEWAGQGLHTGVVVNLLDQKLWNPNPDFLSYTLSKAALEAANTMLAQALAPRLRVVGVAPGLTLTSDFLDDESFAHLHRLSPLGRSSTAHDVAHAVRFALENQSLTGTTLLVDGGQHLMRFERDFSKMV